MKTTHSILQNCNEQIVTHVDYFESLGGTGFWKIEVSLFNYNT